MTYEIKHDQILNELEITVEPFAVCALEGVCSLSLGRVPNATLHYVLGGQGEMRLQGQEPLPLWPGRLVLVPAAVHQILRNHGGGQVGLSSCEPATLDLAEHIARGEAGGNMVVLCAAISLRLRATHGLIDLLRVPLTLNVATAPVAAQAMKALLVELDTMRVGGRAMVRTLLMQCMIEMLREKLEASDPAVAWVAGLADPGLWRALRAMLDDPAASHGVESLAAVAGMSRSRFAERFQTTYGQGAMGFLRELRMARAAQMLNEGREPVKRVAQMVGFSSRSAFTRAFVEAWGQSPSSFRQR